MYNGGTQNMTFLPIRQRWETFQIDVIEVLSLNQSMMIKLFGQDNKWVKTWAWTLNHKLDLTDNFLPSLINY